MRVGAGRCTGPLGIVVICPTLVETERRFPPSVAYKCPDRQTCCTTPRSPDDESEPAEAFISVAAAVALPRSERTLVLGAVPAAQIAVLVHAGDYASIGDTYRRLGAGVASLAAPSGERIRE